MSAWRDLVGAGAACAPDDQQGAASSSAASRNPLGRLADSVLGESRERNTFRQTPEHWTGQEEALLFGDYQQAPQQTIPYGQPPVPHPYALPAQPPRPFSYSAPLPPAGFTNQSRGGDFVSDFLHEQQSSVYSSGPNVISQVPGPRGYNSSWIRPNYDNASLFSWIPEYDRQVGGSSQSVLASNNKVQHSNEEEVLERAFLSSSQPTSSHWSSVQSLVKDYAASTLMHQGFQQDMRKAEGSSGLASELDMLRKRSEEMARSYFPGASDSFIQEQVNEFLQSLRESSDWVSSYHQEPNLEQSTSTWHEEFSKLHLDAQNTTEEWAKELVKEDHTTWAEEFQQDSTSLPWQDEYLEKENFEDTFEDDLRAYLGKDPNELEYEFTEENPYLGNPNAMAEGERLYAEGDLRNAMLAFEAAVRTEPNNAKCWFLLGRTHTEMDQDNPAIICLRRSIEVGGEVADALLELGVSYTNELNHSQALAYLKRWLETQPKYQAFSRQQPSDDAVTAHAYLVEQFRAASVAYPQDVNLYIVLGVLHNLSRDYELAVESFGKAIQLQPNDHRLWNKLGATLANSYQSREALSAYRRAVDLKPSYVRAWVNVGTSYANQGIYEQACRYYLKALQMNPRINHVWNYLRTSLIAMGRNDLLVLTDQYDPQVLVQAMDADLSAAWRSSTSKEGNITNHANTMPVA
ncbi:Peroxisome biogenesis protein 5 [Galdieria sulphuraria]|nr:Peroxisome biogenesis protein 5 [Galdieria sulphuraria]